MKLYKSEEMVAIGGTFKEVGHGGGKIRNKKAKTVTIKDGETLPILNPYTVVTEHKGKNKTQKRQNRWIRFTEK